MPPFKAIWFSGGSQRLTVCNSCHSLLKLWIHTIKLISTLDCLFVACTSKSLYMIMPFTAMKHWYQNKSISIWKTDPFLLQVFLFNDFLFSMSSFIPYKFRVTWIVKETVKLVSYLHKWHKGKAIYNKKIWVLLFGVDTNV